MSPRKLTDADKEELLVSYRDTAATTSTLAEKYGVSSSTISRFLKSRLSKEEYEELIQKKRLGRSNSLKKAKAEKETKAKTATKTTKTKYKTTVSKTKSPVKKKAAVSSAPVKVEATTKAELDQEASTKVEPAPEIVEVKAESPAEKTPPKTTTTDKKTGRRTRSRRSRPKPAPAKVEEQLSLLPKSEPEVTSEQPQPEPEVEAPSASDAKPQVVSAETEIEVNNDLLALAQEIKLGDRQKAVKDLFDDDYDDDEEFDFDEEDGVDDDRLINSTPVERVDEVQILPLQAAAFPRTCYVVTDRMSELIARPLKEFNELGQIPEAEVGERTLPIFDNHRVAKRFTHGRSQKVIKVPNGQLFLKTSACLAAKGITRVLLDGQVYAVTAETIADNN